MSEKEEKKCWFCHRTPKEVHALIYEISGGLWDKKKAKEVEKIIINWYPSGYVCAGCIWLNYQMLSMHHFEGLMELIHDSGELVPNK